MSKPVKQAIFEMLSKDKLHEIQRLQCEIFHTTYNPTNQRTGARILRKPLKGQTMMNYYGPADFPKASKLIKAWSAEEFDVINEEEEYRLEHVEDLKRRGKGAPKKKSEKDDGKKKKKK